MNHKIKWQQICERKQRGEREEKAKKKKVEEEGKEEEEKGQVIGLR